MLRSFNVSMIMITQAYGSIPTKVRENVTHRFVFRLNNVYSIRTLIEDTTGLFFKGNNEKEVKNDIHDIYQEIFKNPHDWMMVRSMPPEIRLGWNNIVYPRSDGIVGGKHKRMIPKRVLEKHELFEEAKTLGFPTYKYKTATVDQLRKYIEMRRLGDELKDKKDIDKNNEDIHQLLENDEKLTKDKAEHKITYLIRKFKNNENPKYLKNLTTLAEYIVGENILPIERVKHYFNVSGMDKYLDF